MARVTPGMMMMMQQQQQQAEPQWMNKPSSIPGCPPGLEYLTMLDQILIKQKINLTEIFTGFEMNNKYVVRNSLGQQVFYAKEKSSMMQRQCCGKQRAFELSITDNNEVEVIHLKRPYKCMCYGQCCSCSKCCQDVVTVEAPPGQVIGKVKQVFSCTEAKYKLEDEHGDTVLYIDGPNFCKCYCPGDEIPFHVMSKDRSTEVGKVSKQWGNIMKELFTDADNFGITFPVDLDVKVKATIIGACFLIDFMYFEQAAGQRRY